ncbi:MAG TPA: S8 family serine peptidase [Candidatus Krumholzibacteria bacterium]|nr:S8 family serine peptidase [Candidatus Krumholzibacteria bacterium]
MNRTIARRAAFAVAALLLCAAFVPTATAGDIAPRLERALASPAFPWLADDGTYTVWVFFSDKGLQGVDLERALDAAQADLDQRTAWRRAKMKAAGERLTDARDLDLAPAYLAQAKATGAELRRESRWLNAASFQASAAQVRALAALPSVRKVDLVNRFSRPELPEQDAAAPAPAEKSSRWSIDYGGNLAAMEQFNVPAVHELGINGQGVIIGMLDTGFRTAHECLAPIPVIAAYDFVNDDGEVDNETGDPSDARNHGTETMSTAMGYMPGAHVAPAFGASAVLAKTEDTSQEVPIEEDQWVAGLEFVELHGADIVSSSLGYLDWYDWADMDGNTGVTTIAADLAVGRGVVVINSAGNERGTSWNHIIAPADGDSVIAVGAVTSAGDFSYFSSPGPSYDGRIKPDVAALGSGNHVASPSNDNGYTSASGTSFSCPLTSGVAALVLSRAPSLTPLQVRDALRETASMASSPNNDYGWGLIDALAAVTYFGPTITHAPLGDTEDVFGPYDFIADMTARAGVDVSTVTLWLRLDGAAWQSTPMYDLGDGHFEFPVPGQPAGTVIDYYLEAADLAGVTTREPFLAPAAFHTFRVGPDVTPPELVHTPLRDQALIRWPATVACEATDNLGVASVELSFALNGGPVQGPFAFTSVGGDRYELVFPLTAAEVAVGDVIGYSITVADAAQTPNVVVTATETFQIIDALGVVLILDDPATAAAGQDLKIDPDTKLPLSTTATTAGKSSAGSLQTWLDDAGYVTDVQPFAGADAADFSDYDVVVLTSGDNAGPVADAAGRTALETWAAAGGKLLVEGGETGYDALSSPGYPSFAAGVLHAVDWNGDNSGALTLVSGQAGHPVATIPNAIPASLPIAYVGYGDEDAVTPAADAVAVYVTTSDPTDAGVLVYDDNPAPQAGQIVYFAFNVEALDPSVGRQLTENALAYLLAAETPATSSLSGRVTLLGEADHSGILVDAGGGHSTLTAPDGSWSLGGLYGGAYGVIATKAGWSTARTDVVLADAESLTGIDMMLSPVVETSYSAAPGAAIPDNNPTGITSVITVPAGESGAVSAISVDIDITHTYQGDLIITLTSPLGAVITLHNRSGGSADNVIGNWPETLDVDGPGSLDDVLGLSNGGDWTLRVSDNAGIDTGTLVSWGLNFTVPAAITAVDDDGLPRVTRLRGNTPNPFNPKTTIAFDLAADGPVSLEVFDTRGRLVRSLVDGRLQAGAHAVVWDGRDARGGSVASGTYLFRLRAGDVTEHRKMALVR